MFVGAEIPKERVGYICISYISIVDRKYYGQVYLEQCKYKIKRN